MTISLEVQRGEHGRGGEEGNSITTRSRDPWRDLGRQASSCAQLTVRAKYQNIKSLEQEMLAAGPCGDGWLMS